LAGAHVFAGERRRVSRSIRIRRSRSLSTATNIKYEHVDTTYRLETPEGIDLQFETAGPVVRGLALMVDVLIRQTAAALIGVGLSNLGGTGVGVWLIVSFLMEWFYSVFFEIFENGQTPGKRIFGLRVIHRDGTPVAWSASVLRNLLRFADFLPVFYVSGLITMLCSKDFERIGDHAAGTLVVHVPKPKSPVERPIVEGTRSLPIALEPGEQRAILNFAERSGELSEARRVELAEILTPLTECTGDAAAVELQRIANGIAGRT
jgi:uncharacterized RDD family membrane protein YckC